MHLCHSILVHGNLKNGTRFLLCSFRFGSYSMHIFNITTKLKDFGRRLIQVVYSTFHPDVFTWSLHISHHTSSFAVPPAVFQIHTNIYDNPHFGRTKHAASSSHSYKQCHAAIIALGATAALIFATSVTSTSYDKPQSSQKKSLSASTTMKKSLARRDHQYSTSRNAW